MVCRLLCLCLKWFAQLSRAVDLYTHDRTDRHGASGGCDFAHKSAGLQAHQGSLPGQLNFITRTASGERRNVLPSDVPNLREILLFVRDGHIHWDNVNTPEM